MGVRDLIKEPAFAVAATALSWARGAKFEDLEKDTSASEGDLVRVFRMTIQLLRAVERAWPEDEHLVSVLRTATKRINRGVVDAEKQLRQGTELDLDDGEDEEEHSLQSR